MSDIGDAPSFTGDSPIAADTRVLRDRRELALVAVERTRMPMVITDPTQPDNPIILANHAFLDLTGYEATEVLGRNCRFLQGPDTAAQDVDVIRQGVRNEDEHIGIELLNYRKDGSSFWNQLEISAVRDSNDKLIYYFASQKDVSSRREAQKLEASERLLLKEIDHRSLNALALVQSVVSLSRPDSIEYFSKSIKGRVDAIARAHRLLARSSWKAAEIRELIAMEAAFAQVSATGPDTHLPPHMVQPLSLVLHELLTNAQRHGALCRSNGLTSLAWEAAPHELTIRWSERGVPIAPEFLPSPGLGLNLVRGTIEQQLGGRFTLAWNDDGLEAVLAIPWNV